MAVTVFVLPLEFFTPYYVTRELPARRDFSAPYQKTTYEESERIKKEWGGNIPGTSLEIWSMAA
jgi:hypothetical protein